MSNFYDNENDFYDEPIRPRRKKKKTRHHMEQMQYGYEQQPEAGFGGGSSFNLPEKLLNFIALAIIFIVSVICGAKFLEVSIPIVLIISIIVLVMGILLHAEPVCISIIISAAILIVGMITKNVDIVLSADAIFLSAVIAFRD